jgi:predicted metalloprotease with PDZ domain
LSPAIPRHTCSKCAARCPNPSPTASAFALPAWIPGSYLIRDFARHIVAIRAESAGQPVRVAQARQAHLAGGAGRRQRPAVTVVCEVYAWDLSVRGAHVDETHAFFNGSSVFLRALGHEQTACLVDIQRPAGKAFVRLARRHRADPGDGRAGAASGTALASTAPATTMS